MKSVWQLQEAKNQLSRVVENALTSGAQTITRHGKPVAMIVAADVYRRLEGRRRIVDILQDCPSDGIDPVRIKDTPRSVEL